MATSEQWAESFRVPPHFNYSYDPSDLARKAMDEKVHSSLAVPRFSD